MFAFLYLDPSHLLKSHGKYPPKYLLDVHLSVLSSPWILLYPSPWLWSLTEWLSQVLLPYPQVGWLEIRSCIHCPVCQILSPLGGWLRQPLETEAAIQFNPVHAMKVQNTSLQVAMDLAPEMILISVGYRYCFQKFKHWKCKWHLKNFPCSIPKC